MFCETRRGPFFGAAGEAFHHGVSMMPGQRFEVPFSASGLLFVIERGRQLREGTGLLAEQFGLLRDALDRVSTGDPPFGRRGRVQQGNQRAGELRRIAGLITVYLLQ